MSSKQNTIYFVATILSGVLNYYFQVFSAQNLSLEEFGALNSWFAELNLLLFGGVFLQYFAVLSRPSVKTKKMVVAFATALSLILLLTYISVPVSSHINFAFALLLGLIFSYFYGLAQIQLGFAIMGVAGLCVASSKLLVPILNNANDINLYFKAISSSYFLGIAALVGYLFITRNKHKSLEQKNTFGILAALVLSVVTATIPQMDIIVIRNTQTPEVIGQFGYVSLLYKAFFFIFMIASQWYLPQQILQDSRTSNQKPVRTLVGLVLFGLLAGVIAAVVYPFGVEFVLGRPIEIANSWIVLTFLHITQLTYVFFLVQSYCTSGAIRLAATLAASTVACLILFSNLGLSVEKYLISVCLVEIIVIVMVSTRKVKSGINK